MLVSPTYLDTPVSGDITGISFLSGNTTEYLNGEFSNCDIYFCYTSLGELTDNFADNYDGNTPIKVHTANPLDLDWTTHEWQDEIECSPSWYYDGTGNFILEISYDGTNSEPGNYTTSWMTNGVNLALDASDKYAATGSFLVFSNWLRFEIAPNTAIESTSIGSIKIVFK